MLIAGKWKAQKEKEGNEMRRGGVVRWPDSQTIREGSWRGWKSEAAFLKLWPMDNLNKNIQLYNNEIWGSAPFNQSLQG